MFRFFFSGRRRHTRCSRDWSSDVCSSDLRKAGAKYKGLCPFHGEKTPSFSVDKEKGFFHCFGCGVGGDVFKFVELQEKVGFGEALRLLAGRFGIPIPELEGGGDERGRDRK